MSIEHTSAAPTARTQTGIPEFTFADLHDSAQLARLHERFCQDVQAVDPGLWREWDAYQSAPDAPRSPLVLSDLLIAMACHVSRFVARLFVDNLGRFLDGKPLKETVDRAAGY